MRTNKVNRAKASVRDWFDHMDGEGRQPRIRPSISLDVPAVVCPENGNPPATCQNPVIINNLPAGSITFRTYFNPVTVGCFVAHCHTLDHEDLGMMPSFDTKTI